MSQNHQIDFFDVPFCRIEEQNILFSKTSKPHKQVGNQDLKIVHEYTASKINERLKYPNKLLEQLQRIEVNEESDKSLVSNLLSSSCSLDPVNSSFNYTHIVNETLNALSMSDTEDALSQWDPMQTAYEQRAFNSYQETPFNANMTEKHSPVRGTRISPAKGSSDEVTLYVSNIPTSLEEDGMKNMFSRCGRCKVKKCRSKTHSSTTTFGFVTYGSVKDAETAISEYNDFPFGDTPKLKVRLSRNYTDDNSNQFIPLSKDTILGPSHNGNASSSSDKEDCRQNKVLQENDKENSAHNENEFNTPTPTRVSTSPVQKISTGSLHKTKGPRLFVQGLPAAFTSVELQSLFSEQVQCTDTCVVKPTTQSRRTTYGFASFNSVEEADRAIDLFNGYHINNRTLKISYSNQSAKDFGKKVAPSEEDDYYSNLYGELDSSFTNVDVDLSQFTSGNKANSTTTTKKNHCNNNSISSNDNVINEPNDNKKKMKEKSTCEDAMQGLMLSDLPVKPFPDEKQFHICVTEVVSPHLFYGQLLTSDTLTALYELTESLQMTYSNPDLPAFTPKLNEICVAQFHEDQMWYRASVVQYNNDYTARMFFFDFGNKSDVKTSNIRSIDENFLVYPRLAVKLCLCGVQSTNNNGSWSNETVLYMKSLVENKQLIVQCQQIDGERMKCAIQFEDGDDLVNKLIERGCGCVAEEISSLSASREVPSVTGSVQSSSSSSVRSREEKTQSAPQRNNGVPQVKASNTCDRALDTAARTSTSQAASFILPSESSFDVLVTHVQDPSLFYGQKATHECLQTSIDITKDLARYFQKDTALPYKPFVDEVCAGFYENYNEWYRVLVTTVHTDCATVYLVDYGETIDIAFRCLRKLPDELHRTRSLAFPMSLADVQPREGSLWCDQAVSTLTDLLTPMKKSEVEVVRRSVDKLHVAIGCKDQDGAQLLIANNFASLSKLPPSSAPTLDQRQHENAAEQTAELRRDVDKYTNLPALQLPDDNHPITVSHVESLDLFYVQLYDQFVANNVQNISNELSMFCKQHKNIRVPPVNTLCCALFDGEWSRAYTLDVGKSTAKVFFIDFGNTSDVTFDNICQISDSFENSLSVPSLAIACKLFNPSSIPHSECMVQKFRDSVLNKLVNMKVKNNNCTPIEIHILEHPIDSFKSLERETVEVNNNVPRAEETTTTTTTLIVRRLMEDEIPKVNVSDTGDVAIVHVDSLLEFYGQHIDFDSLNQLNSLTDDMTDELMTVRNTTSYVPVVGEVCAGFFISFDQFFRVRVSSVDENNNSTRVQSIDYGNCETLSLDDVTPLPSKYASFPAQAINFALHNVPASVTSSEAANDCVQYFGSTCINQRSTFAVKNQDQNKYFVELVVDGKDVKEQLTNAGYLLDSVESSFEDVAASPEALTTAAPAVVDKYTSLPPIKLPHECDVMITHIESLDKLFLQPAISLVLEALPSFNERLCEYCHEHTADSFKPVANTLCLGRQESVWYRAYALTVDDRKANVFFIDYGNVGELSFKDVRPFDDQFLTAPSLAVQCQLYNPKGIPSTSSAVVSRFQSIAYEELASMKVVREGDAVVEVELRVNHMNVIEELEECHAAELEHKIVDVKEPVTEINDVEAVAAKMVNVEEPMAEIVMKGPAKEIPPVIQPVHITSPQAAMMDDNNDISLTSSIPEITKANYAPIKTQTVTKPTPSQLHQSCTFVVSTLPNTVHPLDSVAMKMNVQDLSSGTFELRITHVESPHLMYANVLDREVLQEIKKLSEEMLTFFQSGLSTQEMTFRAGVICAAFDVDDDVWRRAIATKIEESVSTVFFIDRGHFMDLPNTRIKPLLQQFKTLPAQAIPLKLITVKPVDGQQEWSNDTIKYLRSIIAGQIVKVRLEFKENILFGVRIKFAGQPLDKLLEESEHAVKVEPELPQFGGASTKSKAAIPFNQIADAIDLEKPPKLFEAIVTCVVSPRLFYCRINDEANLAKIDEISAELKQLFGEKNSDTYSSDFTNGGELCAVKHEEVWYRGFAFSISDDDKIDIWLIDYGWKITAPKNAVYPLPENMVEFPGQCINVQLQYVIPPSGRYLGAAVKRFKELTLNRVLLFKVKTVRDTMHRVLARDKETGIDIGTTLVQEGFAMFVSTNDAKPQPGGERIHHQYYPGPNGYHRGFPARGRGFPRIRGRGRGYLLPAPNEMNDRYHYYHDPNENGYEEYAHYDYRPPPLMVLRGRGGGHHHPRSPPRGQGVVRGRCGRSVHHHHGGETCSSTSHSNDSGKNSNSKDSKEQQTNKSPHGRASRSARTYDDESYDPYYCDYWYNAPYEYYDNHYYYNHNHPHPPQTYYRRGGSPSRGRAPFVRGGSRGRRGAHQ